MPMHECKQEQVIEKHQKELFEGREGRPSMQVRLDRCERVIDKMMWVSMSLLLTVLVAAGTLIWQSVVHGLRSSRAAADHVYGSTANN